MSYAVLHRHSKIFLDKDSVTNAVDMQTIIPLGGSGGMFPQENFEGYTF